MKRETLVSAIRKIEREGYAENRIVLLPRKKNCWIVQSQGSAILPNGKKSMYVGTPDDPRYQEWRSLIDRRNQLKQYKRALKALAVLDSVDPPKNQPSVEWYTPPEFVDVARAVLGAIDLDPASNAKAQQWIKAKAFYTKADNGLEQPWLGRVWCNPPYGKKTKPFMERALQLYRAGEIKSAIFLVNRTGAAWYKHLSKQFDAVCEVKTRIAFLDPSGQPQNSPRYYNDFLYIGPHSDRFREAFAPYCW